MKQVTRRKPQIHRNDVFIQDDELQADISLPQFEPHEISVATYDSGIDIKATHQEIRETDTSGDHIFSKINNTYWRRIPIPQDADTTQLQTIFRSGILSIRLPLGHR